MGQHAYVEDWEPFLLVSAWGCQPWGALHNHHRRGIHVSAIINSVLHTANVLAMLRNLLELKGVASHGEGIRLHTEIRQSEEGLRILVSLGEPVLVSGCVLVCLLQLHHHRFPISRLVDAHAEAKDRRDGVSKIAALAPQLLELRQIGGVVEFQEKVECEVVLAASQRSPPERTWVQYKINNVQLFDFICHRIQVGLGPQHRKTRRRGDAKSPREYRGDILEVIQGARGIFEGLACEVGGTSGGCITLDDGSVEKQSKVFLVADLPSIAIRLPKHGRCRLVGWIVELVERLDEKGRVFIRRGIHVSAIIDSVLHTANVLAMLHNLLELKGVASHGERIRVHTEIRNSEEGLRILVSLGKPVLVSGCVLVCLLQLHHHRFPISRLVDAHAEAKDRRDGVSKIAALAPGLLELRQIGGVVEFQKKVECEVVLAASQRSPPERTWVQYKING